MSGSTNWSRSGRELCHTHCSWCTLSPSTLSPSTPSPSTLSPSTLSPSTALLSDKHSCGMLLALVIWLMIFMTRPHKEERFLFPVYPLLCFAATYGMERMEVSGHGGRVCTVGCPHLWSPTLLCKGRSGLLEWAESLEGQEHIYACCHGNHIHTWIVVCFTHPGPVPR